MRSKKNVETLKMQKGEYHEKEFDNYLDMATHAVDWTLFCTYQLQPSFSEGIYKILQLPSMQIAYTVMSGGIMFDYVAPEGTITFSVMRHISHKASLDQMKLETGMIAVVDDSKIYNFICSEGVEIYDISLNEEADPKLRSLLCDAVDRYYLDSDGQIGELLEVIIEAYEFSGESDFETFCSRYLNVHSTYFITLWFLARLYLPLPIRLELLPESELYKKLVAQRGFPRFAEDENYIQSIKVMMHALWDDEEVNDE